MDTQIIRSRDEIEMVVVTLGITIEYLLYSSNKTYDQMHPYFAESITCNCFTRLRPSLQLSLYVKTANAVCSDEKFSILLEINMA